MTHNSEKAGIGDIIHMLSCGSTAIVVGFDGPDKVHIVYRDESGKFTRPSYYTWRPDEYTIIQKAQ